MESERDVIVIGAGPAGTRLAMELAKNGMNVAVYEKRQEIGAPKRCGEGISANSIRRLNLEDIPERCIRAKIKGALIYAPNGKCIEIKFDEVQGFIIERKLFDKWLAEKAAREGAYIQSKTEITDLIREKGRIVGVKGVFLGEEFSERAKVIVSCEGVEGVIARKAGFPPINPKDYESAAQFEMAGIEVEENYLEFYFDAERFPRGYLWVFPKGKDVANIGIGIASYVEKPAVCYLREWLAGQERFRNGSILEVNSGGLPVGGITKELVKDNFLLVGDIARQVNPIHGGGLFEAQYAAKIAAEVLKESFERQDFSENFLKKYSEIWYESRGKSLERIEKIRAVLENMDNEDLNFLAENLSSENIIDLAHGEKLWLLAKILAKRPKLIKYARYLV